MEECHLLLGRSWLYDKRAIYDGFKYTYSFMIDGKISLGPLNLVSNPKPSKRKKEEVLITHGVSKREKKARMSMHWSRKLMKHMVTTMGKLTMMGWHVLIVTCQLGFNMILIWLVNCMKYMKNAWGFSLVQGCSYHICKKKRLLLKNVPKQMGNFVFLVQCAPRH